ncbi:DUF3331 domain-containing protein [Paraburkholderia sp. LEh10]|jgi:hypothetical protein|uniref:DUF3331 domain-containing protein n=1 Tax=Paraburkholderia sp. LEh10 TaxID=2821353 RepID=UPI001AE2151D|nr:DUF3331 domain-containing protein [Paraburkholderia sp. LEh10]MBP0595046.1 DUF3331 domain-containing protein [Paraburkholderia sp. LEh10]
MQDLVIPVAGRRARSIRDVSQIQRFHPDGAASVRSACLVVRFNRRLAGCVSNRLIAREAMVFEVAGETFPVNIGLPKADRAKTFQVEIMMVILTDEEVVRRTLLDVLGHISQTSNTKHGTEPEKKKRFRFKRNKQIEISRTDGIEPPISHFLIVDRPSSLTVSVCWSDPRYGRHDEQTWRLGRARFESFCLLTGGAIQHGDQIFRPRATRGGHAESDRMILASAVDGFCLA